MWLNICFELCLPVKVHLVYLWVIRLNAFLLYVEEIGEINK